MAKSLLLCVVQEGTTHWTVWEVLPLDMGDDRNEAWIQKDLAFRDRNGDTWQIHCHWYPNKERAEGHAKDSQEHYPSFLFNVEVVDSRGPRN